MAYGIRFRLPVCVTAAVLFSGCGWVDDTGRQVNTSPAIAIDDVNQMVEGTTVQWPLRDFDEDGNLVALQFELIDSGDSVEGCSAQFSALEVAPTLRDACQPLLSDEQCQIEFDVGSSAVSFDIPALRRPLALQYTVEVVDEDGATDSSTVDLCVATTSEAPVVVEDDYAVSYLGELVSTGTRFDNDCVAQGGTGVLANDSDDFDYREGWDSGQACLRAVLVDVPQYAASFELDADGGFRYESSGAAGPGASDSFSYRVSDGVNESAVAVATISITGDNNAPVALNPVLNTDEDQSLVISLSQLAEDPESTTLRLQSFSAAANGTVQQVGTDLRFTPDLNFFGKTTFSAVIADASGLTVTSEIQVNVVEVNDAPVLSGLPSAFVLNVDNPLEPGEFRWTFSVSDEETDVSSLQMSLGLDAAVVAGQVIGPSEGGEVTVVLTPVHNGSSTVTVRVQDGGSAVNAAEMAEQQIPVTVNGMNLAPVAVNDDARLFKNSEIVVDVLDNDSDPDGAQGSLTISAIVQQPSHGDVVINAQAKTLKYSADSGFSGSDELIYEVEDADGARSEATLKLTVVNRDPVVEDENYTMFETEIAVFNVLLNDSDPDGDSLSISLGDSDFVGTARVVAGGIRYSPLAGYIGLVTVPYSVEDGDGGAAQGRLVIRVRSQSTER